MTKAATNDQRKTPPKRGFVSRDAVMRDTDHLPYWNHLSGKFQSVRMSHCDALSRCEVTPWGLEVFAKAHHSALWLQRLIVALFPFGWRLMCQHPPQLHKETIYQICPTRNFISARQPARLPIWSSRHASAEGSQTGHNACCRCRSARAAG